MPHRIDDRLGIRKRREAFLRAADIAQQRDRIKSGIDFLELGANRVGRAGVGGQALVWCCRRAVCLAHTRTVALLGYQLNEGWKKFTNSRADR
ncbi:hypothetical protein ACVIHF_004536 [Bradyrhizobium sp. USDA 4506]